MTTIRKVQTKRDLKQFILFQYQLYRDNPYFVCEPYLMLKEVLNKKKNPFFSHSNAELFLAERDSQTVGRIAAIINRNHLKKYDDHTGFFGFFECENNPDTADLLFNTARDWLKNQGLTKICGPTNFSTNDSCGFLIDGFEDSPVVLMPYNKTYYPDLAEACGFTKSMDLFAYTLHVMDLPEELKHAAKALQKQLYDEKGITIRPINLNQLDKEILNIGHVYNAANEGNWGFVPLTEEEIIHMGADMKFITSKESGYVWVAEKDGHMIGYYLSIPDINRAFKKLNNGSLFPLGIFKLLHYKKRTDRIRIIILGILKEYRNIGIDICFYINSLYFCQSRGISTAEAGYILENNIPMNKILKHRVKMTKEKTYRMYEKPL